MERKHCDFHLHEIYITTVTCKSRRLSTLDIANASEFGLVSVRFERIAPLELFGTGAIFV